MRRSELSGSSVIWEAGPLPYEHDTHVQRPAKRPHPLGKTRQRWPDILIMPCIGGRSSAGRANSTAVIYSLLRMAMAWCDWLELWICGRLREIGEWIALAFDTPTSDISPWTDGPEVLRGTPVRR